MKSVILASFLMAGMTLFSCNGNNSGGGRNQKSESKNEGGVPVSENNGSSKIIHLDSFDNSQGVGQFHEVEVSKTIDPKMAEQGEEIFQTRCTTCHQATDQRLIGPGLKGVTKIRTPAWIMNMITNPDKMVQEDPVAKAIYNEFSQTQMTNQGLTGKEVREVLEFLRQNDSK